VFYGQGAALIEDGPEWSLAIFGFHCTKSLLLVIASSFDAAACGTAPRFVTVNCLHYQS